MSIINTVAGNTPYTSVENPGVSSLGTFEQAVTGQQSVDLPVVEQSGQGGESRDSQTGGTPFESILSSLLPEDKQSQVNEEQLFSALIAERLTTQVGENAAKDYRHYLEERIAEMTRSDGYVPVEDASRAALKDLVDNDVVSNREAEEIHAQAFQAAQLDSNAEAIFDGMGSTVAVAMVEMALQSSTSVLAKIDSGELDAGTLSLNYRYDGGVNGAGGTTTAQQVGGTGTPTAGFVGGNGFLFKPVSENDHKLVILLPSAMSGNVDNVSLVDGSGRIIEAGDFYRDYDDGRPIFRFDRPGAAYPGNIVVNVAMRDGSVKDYNIADPSQRYQ
ncbi:MAG: hypothetical protein ABFS19_07070 [Thermodesulfobacteriota bacterium]